MANKKKPPAGTGADRRARVEALKKEQKAKERKKTLGFVAIAVLVGGALIAIPTMQILNEKDEAKRAFNEYGIPIGLAQCDPIQTDKVGKDDGEHEEDPSKKITYETAPPSHGPHFVSPAEISARGFYTAADTPRVEELVHNLEHGYNVVWYTPAVPAEQVTALQEIAEKMRDENDTRKFVVAAWDVSRGAFPANKTVAITHWGAPTTEGDYATSTGYRQYCGQVSGEAINRFVLDHPSSDSPEPFAA